jgi:hypothetical protein
MADKQKQQQNQQLNIELPSEIADGIYANLVMIAHSPEEFILDFIRVMPGLPKARVKSRIVITPAHAKRLLAALQDNIGKYEGTYGPIGEASGGQPDFSFNIPGGEA